MAIICDIDGTIADHGDERGHFEWDKVHTDTPIMPIVRLVTILHAHHKIIFVSGREETCYVTTRQWLGKQFPWFTLMNALYMRKEGDNREDTVVKREIYEIEIKPYANDIELVLDDRDQVVAMWRDLGLVCLQTRPGLL
jgi:hydroxymethylpyrimidine pyrophosphatase-like HAD family hydrolase